ncbi:MAG: hydantoin utilization protein B [bacterium]|nr:MAG: hydantoin utilization protein B [bacterium]
MCLAIPGKVIEITEENGLLMGKIDYAGSVSKVCLAYVPDVQVDQYAIVHAGFAISILNEEEASKTFKVWKEIEEYIEEPEDDKL